jgi:CubicO group peptidase (beta-lactamase class C family)
MVRRFSALSQLSLLVLLTLCTTAVRVGAELVPLPAQPAEVPWPTRAWVERAPGGDVDRAKLAAAIDQAFALTGRAGLPDTRALIVVHHGAIVAERYAPGFGPDKRLQSWSMAKTITQALVGILVGQGKLQVSQPANVPVWKGNGDPRAALTLDQLLHMTSGVDNADGDLQDPAKSVAVRMMFGDRTASMAAYAASLPLAHPPDTHWAYSTATSMIVAEIVQRTVGGSKEAMLAFMRRELFDRLGMRSAVPEFDAGGTFMGGGFFWATARDYARFGLLYLRDGIWDGGRVLPQGWVDYSRTPAPAPNITTYGAHMWLNHDPKPGPFKMVPGAPASIFGASGNDGQMILVVPTHDLVLVRLGEMHTATWPTTTADMAAIVAAFPG